MICDVVDIDVCHLLLERPWQFGVDAAHKGKDNVYDFWWNSQKVCLMPLTNKKKNAKAEGKNILIIVKSYLDDNCDSYKKLENKKELELKVVPNDLQSLLGEFADITLLEVPKSIPPLWNIQYHMDLLHGVSLPNLPRYRMSPHGHVILQGRLMSYCRKCPFVRVLVYVLYSFVCTEKR